MIKQDNPLCGREEYLSPAVNRVATAERMCICASIAQLDDYSDLEIWDL